jgi:hypothetical protein
VGNNIFSYQGHGRGKREQKEAWEMDLRIRKSYSTASQAGFFKTLSFRFFSVTPGVVLNINCKDRSDVF